jgi:uncharacterized protein (UPF0276 family)
MTTILMTTARRCLLIATGVRWPEPVWVLLDHVLRTAGSRPVLIEWDTDVPEWPVLAAEAARAKTALQTAVPA